MNVKTNIPEHLWVLPPYVAKPPRNIDDNGIPAVDTLKPQQKYVYDTLISYLQEELPSDVVMIAIEGYAGTGKTYVITQVLKYFVMKLHHQIAITAPTNKAVKVLRNTANFEHTLITYSTIHKLLGLKALVDDRTGKQYFQRDKESDGSINEMHSLVVDETSMLQDELYELIAGEATRSKRAASKIDFLEHAQQDLKIIFLGDPIQIPPIGKIDCIPFNPGKAKEDGIVTLKLTEIIRQKEGNPILDLATLVRENHKNALLPYDRETKITSQGGIIMIDADDKESLYKLCEKYFDSENFKQDADFAKVIAWTNRTVNFMNRKIRLQLYKEHIFRADEAITGKPIDMLPKILVGEKLIANSPIMDRSARKPIIMFNTNDEFEVVSYEIVEEEVFKDLTVSMYKTVVKYTDAITGKEKTETIPILHEDYDAAFKAALERIKTYTLSLPVAMRGEHWRRYFRLKDTYADVIYNYAITAHKSQGSTYENAIVIVADIDKNKKIEERNRIKYVAFTRARSHLFIVE